MAKKLDMDKTLYLAMGGVLTAIVIVLQLLGSFIKFGPFSISLVLAPIVIGAALCDWKISTWLGFVFGVVVLFQPDTQLFYNISIRGTIAIVILKGAVAGLAAGLVYKLASKLNKYFAVVVSAIVCPIVNTGIFLLGCKLFFYNTIAEWAAGADYNNVGKYMIFGLVGANFLVEMATNIVLCPVIVRIINLFPQRKAKKAAVAE